MNCAKKIFNFFLIFSLISLTRANEINNIGDLKISIQFVAPQVESRKNPTGATVLNYYVQTKSVLEVIERVRDKCSSYYRDSVGDRQNLSNIKKLMVDLNQCHIDLTNKPITNDMINDVLTSESDAGFIGTLANLTKYGNVGTVNPFSKSEMRMCSENSSTFNILLLQMSAFTYPNPGWCKRMAN